MQDDGAAAGVAKDEKKTCENGKARQLLPAVSLPEKGGRQAPAKHRRGHRRRGSEAEGASGAEQGGPRAPETEGGGDVREKGGQPIN